MTGRFPFSGIPCGWYVVAASSELEPGEVKGRRYFGRELVLFRTRSGEVCLADAHCPHMGAHLAGGRVEGKLPEWEVPQLPLAGWSPLVSRKWEIPTHPQETTENSVDFGHFTSVHNFVEAEMTKPVETSGPLLESGYAVRASLQSVGLSRLSVRAEFDVEVWGLGYSLVHVRVPAFGASCRLFVLPTPVDEENIELRLACMSLHPSKLLGSLFRTLVFRGFCQEVEEDTPIWSRKAYLASPALATGDGPIASYRRGPASSTPRDTTATLELTCSWSRSSPRRLRLQRLSRLARHAAAQGGAGSITSSRSRGTVGASRM